MRMMTCFVATATLATLAACAAPSPDSGFAGGKNGNGDPSPGQFDTGPGGDGKSKPSGPGCVKDPSFYDSPGDNCDNDGDGTVDNPPTCDADISANATAEDFARAMGICEKAAQKGYGLVSAKFTRGYNRAELPENAQHGVLQKFGNVVKPREGKKLGVISTGYAQEFNGSPGTPFGGGAGGRDWFGSRPGGTGTAPPGFPKGAENCPQSMDVNDVVNVKLELKAPKNASGFKFDFNFFSGEWPAFICTRYNDGFIAYLTAKSYNGGKGDNISFDVKRNPVSVNNGFFDRCTPKINLGCSSAAAGISACPGGPAELAGTGFGILGDACGQGEESTLGGATGWLSSNAPIQPEETFTLELMIWDTGDGVLDSSVLLDNFHWLAGAPVETSTQRPDDVK